MAVEAWLPHDVDGPQHRAQAMSKIRRYEAAGIKLIWVINPVAKEALVYVPGQLEADETLGINEELDGKDIIPGFKLKIRDLFPASKSK